MKRVLSVLTLFIFSLNCNIQAQESNPLGIVIVMRHGARAPIRPYPTDPYDISFWPNGWANLTEVGYRKQLELGKWLGQRYRNVFGQMFSKENIHILSSGSIRTIFSAKAALSGIFGNEQIPDNIISDMEILEKHQDNLIIGDKPCDKLNEMRQYLLKSKPFSANYDTFYEFLRNMTHFPVYNFTWAFFLSDTLECENWHNYILPEWTKGVYPHQFRNVTDLYYLLKTYNSDVARLEVGPLWNRIISFLNTIVLKPSNSPKAFVISGHQQTLVNILNTMMAYDNTPPSYSSSIIFELHKYNDDLYIETFFKNETDLIRINLRNCSDKCNLVDFSKLLQVLNISPMEWDYECDVIKSSSSVTASTIVVYVVVVIFVICVSFYIVIKTKRKCRKPFLLLRQSE